MESSDKEKAAYAAQRQKTARQIEQHGNFAKRPDAQKQLAGQNRPPNDATTRQARRKAQREQDRMVKKALKDVHKKEPGGPAAAPRTVPEDFQ